MVNERVDSNVDPNNANHEPVETKSSDQKAEESLNLSEEPVNEPVDIIKEPVYTLEEPVVVEPVAMNEEPVTVEPPTEIPTTSENIGGDDIAPTDESNQEAVINPEVQLPEMTLPVPTDDNVAIDGVNDNTGNKLLEDEKPTEVETPDNSNPQQAEEDAGFFNGWFGSGAGSQEEVTGKSTKNQSDESEDIYNIWDNVDTTNQEPIIDNSNGPEIKNQDTNKIKIEEAAIHQEIQPGNLGNKFQDPENPGINFQDPENPGNNEPNVAQEPFEMDNTITNNTPEEEILGYTPEMINDNNVDMFEQGRAGFRSKSMVCDFLPLT